MTMKCLLHLAASVPVLLNVGRGNSDDISTLLNI